MTTFIKAGLWKQAKKALDGELNLNKLIQQNTPIPPDPRPYKVYTALLTQSGTNAPTAIVLENTLGEEVTYDYDSQGVYIIKFNQTFTDINKIFVIIGNGNVGNNFYSLEKDIETSTLYTISGNTGTNGLLTNTEIEIRVYN